MNNEINEIINPSEDEVVGIFVDILKILVKMEQIEMFHGDIRPEYIVKDSSKKVHLIPRKNFLS